MLEAGFFWNHGSHLNFLKRCPSDPFFEYIIKNLSQVNVGDNLDKIVDEYTYAELVDPDFYKERLRTHWDTFVTKEDFEKVGSAGVTHVRIPVGYW